MVPRNDKYVSFFGSIDYVNQVSVTCVKRSLTHVYDFLFWGIRDVSFLVIV